ncbi:hypothetical protein O181_043563 [Austropuccinia psidii MF-1]|uniref:Uncharacterized protein n=1 Tax=Austropuccinia psidii MF-1 TaxID=1389203 RepID=A0A9Q3DND9_9BASI|nr:hypothetical protein [Austropuccinia psidii MF-1]
MTIIYKEVRSHTSAVGVSRWPLDNFKSKPAYDFEVAAEIPIHFIEIERKKNFRFLSGHQKLVPQTVETLTRKEQKLPYWE